MAVVSLDDEPRLTKTDLGCGCKMVQGRKGLVQLPCEQHRVNDRLSVQVQVPARGRFNGARFHLQILDEAAAMTAPLRGQRWTHVFASIERPTKGEWKGCIVIRVRHLADDGQVYSLCRIINGAEQLFNEWAAIGRTLDQMLEEFERYGHIRKES